MLKLEDPINAARPFSSKRPNVAWATLDEVPGFALSTMEHMYNMLIKPFERSYGIIINGPMPNDMNVCNSCAYWGRRVQLPTNEMLQLRFSPRTMLDEAHDGIALISIKVTNQFGHTHVRTAILFPPELDIPPSIDPLRRSCHIIAPRGLHMLMITFFRQHSAEMGATGTRLSNASWTIDPYGYGSVRSTTFSITNTVPNNRGKKGESKIPPFNHGSATLVAPGTSNMVVAAEIVNCDMPDASRRASEPIHNKEWSKLMDTATQGIHGTDPEVGRSAIAGSVAIAELLSGEGLLGILSNPFFEGALPDKMKTPQGVALLIAMSVRIAMVPGLHGLVAGSHADQLASCEVRSLFEASIPPLPMMNNPKKWAIDLAISMAKRNTKSARNYQGKADIGALTMDQLVFWQRSGQSTVTSTFGPGTTLDKMPKHRFGTPWRFTDPLLAARDAYTYNKGIKMHDVREPLRINMADVSKRRTYLLKLLLETERYLRSGVFHGVRLAPPNDDAPVEVGMMNNHIALQEMIMPEIISRMAEGKACNPAEERALQDEMYSTYNMSAMAQATMDITEALTAGPVVHFKHRISAYLVAEPQMSLCCDCDEPVHVLQGIMLNYAYGECTACHAKRCLKCSSQYGLSMMTASSGKWGSTCRRCGAAPPRAETKRIIDPATGKESLKVTLEGIRGAKFVTHSTTTSEATTATELTVQDRPLSPNSCDEGCSPPKIRLNRKKTKPTKAGKALEDALAAAISESVDEAMRTGARSPAK